MAIPGQLPHLLHNRNYSKTRPLKLNSFSHYSFSLYRPDSSYSLSSFFFSFFWHELLNYRLQFINTIWKTKQITQGRRGKEQKGVHQLQKGTYGIPPWKIGAAFLSCPLFRVFPRGESDIRAAVKFGSSVTVRLRELTGGLETSNWRRTCTGLWETFFFPFPGELRRRLWLATLCDGAATGT